MVLEITDASGRAECKICHNIIMREPDSGDLHIEGKQIRGNLGSGNYAYHYHIDCFKERYYRFLYEMYQLMKENEREDLEKGN